MAAFRHVVARLIGISDGMISVFFSPTWQRSSPRWRSPSCCLPPQGLFGNARYDRIQKSWALHLGIIALLFVLQFILPAYHHGSLARVMVLTCYAMGYNILFGYTGLLSLGHAMFFAAGMYGLSLSIQHLDWTAGPALLAGLAAGFAVALVIGMLLLRTAGVAFMIVTLMFAQAGYLTVLYFGEWTRGDEGFVIQQELRRIAGLTCPTRRAAISRRC